LCSCYWSMFHVPSTSVSRCVCLYKATLHLCCQVVSISHHRVTSFCIVGHAVALVAVAHCRYSQRDGQAELAWTVDSYSMAVLLRGHLSHRGMARLSWPEQLPVIQWLRGHLPHRGMARSSWPEQLSVIQWLRGHLAHRGIARLSWPGQLTVIQWLSF